MFLKIVTLAEGVSVGLFLALGTGRDDPKFWDKIAQLHIGEKLKKKRQNINMKSMAKSLNFFALFLYFS